MTNILKQPVNLKWSHIHVFIFSHFMVDFMPFLTQKLNKIKGDNIIIFAVGTNLKFIVCVITNGNLSHVVPIFTAYKIYTRNS